MHVGVDRNTAGLLDSPKVTLRSGLMRVAVLVVAIECALVFPTILLASRSLSNSDLISSITSPQPGDDLTSVLGEVRNLGKDTATNVQVQVRVFDAKY